MRSGFVFRPCFGCHGKFGFNPTRVPTICIDDDYEPICRTCVDRVNPARIALGLEAIVPMPGAYSFD